MVSKRSGGILAPGCPCVKGIRNTHGHKMLPLSVVQERAQRTDKPFESLALLPVRDFSGTNFGMHLIYKINSITFRLSSTLQFESGCPFHSIMLPFHIKCFHS